MLFTRSIATLGSVFRGFVVFGYLGIGEEELTQGRLGLEKVDAPHSALTLSIRYLLDIYAGPWDKEAAVSRLTHLLPQQKPWWTHLGDGRKGTTVFGSDTELGERRTRFPSWLYHWLALWHGDRLLCFSASLKCRVWELGKKNKCFFGGCVVLSTT